MAARGLVNGGDPTVRLGGMSAKREVFRPPTAVRLSIQIRYEPLGGGDDVGRRRVAEGVGEGRAGHRLEEALQRVPDPVDREAHHVVERPLDRRDAHIADPLLDPIGSRLVKRLIMINIIIDLLLG